MWPFFFPNYNPPGYSDQIDFGGKSRFDREKEHKDGSKAVCKKHGRAYVVGVGCPYCE
jgi:hypothetical protein